MARFVLQPCKVRGSAIVQDLQKDTLEVDWQQLRRLLAPTNSRRAREIVSQIQRGAFVGLLRSGRQLTNFLLVNPDQSGNINTQLKQSPTFADRIELVFFVEEAELDSSFLETS